MAQKKVVLQGLSLEAKCDGEACFLAQVLESDPLSIQSALEQTRILKNEFQVSQIPGSS
jgi:hypothetical protein